MAQLVTAPALLIAGKVSNLTDAIADLVELLGNEDTHKLLVGLAEGLGAPEEQFGVETGSSRPDARLPREQEPAELSGSSAHAEPQ